MLNRWLNSRIYEWMYNVKIQKETEISQHKYL